MKMPRDDRRVRIITDSASDISQKTASEWDITVLPLTILFGEEEFLDGIDLSPADFYERLRESRFFPKTSQVSPYTYEQAFRKAKENGESVLCFCLSSSVSGSYQSACLAAEETGGDIRVFDTKQFCISEYIIIERAVRLRDEGLDAAQIAERIEPEIGKAHVLAAFDTLEYLKRGGRLSAAASRIGNLLSIKPVLTIRDGTVEVLGKARGFRHACSILNQQLDQYRIDYEKPVCFGFTGNPDKELHELRERTVTAFRFDLEPEMIAVGATIGAYAGPGAIAAAFFEY